MNYITNTIMDRNIWIVFHSFLYLYFHRSDNIDIVIYWVPRKIFGPARAPHLASILFLEILFFTLLLQMTSIIALNIIWCEIGWEGQTQTAYMRAYWQGLIFGFSIHFEEFTDKSSMCTLMHIYKWNAEYFCITLEEKEEQIRKMCNMAWKHLTRISVMANMSREASHHSDTNSTYNIYIILYWAWYFCEGKEKKLPYIIIKMTRFRVTLQFIYMVQLNGFALSIPSGSISPLHISRPRFFHLCRRQLWVKLY